MGLFHFGALFGLAASAALWDPAPAWAGDKAILLTESPADISDYRAGDFWTQTDSIKLEIAGLVAGTVVVGFLDWDWGDTSFNFQSEGFFGKDTKNGGMDKLGHAYGTYVLTDFFTDAIEEDLSGAGNADITAAMLSMGIMTGVEVMDGFAAEHGFAWQDIVANAVGASFSVLRHRISGLEQKLDFRLEYFPSGNAGGFRPHSDYSGQKYLLALKLSGFEEFETTPLRYVELYAGFYARGFTREEKDDGEERRQEGFFGIGVNLSELLLSNQEVRHHWAGKTARKFLEYNQIPYSYIATKYK